MKMLEGIGLFQLASQRMQYLSKRQAIIGENIANADTPGYKSKDLTAFSTSLSIAQGDKFGSTGPLQMVTDNPNDIGFGASGTVSARVNNNARAYDEKFDSNNVSVEEQELKANQVADAYSIATMAYAKNTTLLKDTLA